MITQCSTSTGNVVTQEAITLRDTEMLKGQRTRLFSFPLFKKVYIPPKQIFWPFIPAQLHSKLRVDFYMYISSGGFVAYLSLSDCLC